MLRLYMDVHVQAAMTAGVRRRGLEVMPPTTWLAGLMLEESKNPCQESILVHHGRSTCASAASTAGSQKVMSMEWHKAMASESAVHGPDVS